MTVSAVSPWRTALQRDACFPASVLGPVLLRELRRLASICLREVIEGRPQVFASFCQSDPVQFADQALSCFGCHRLLWVVDGFPATGYERQRSDRYPPSSTMPLHRHSGGVRD